MEGILEEFRESQRLLKEQEDRGRLLERKRIQEGLARKRREKIRKQVEKIVEEYRESERQRKEREERERLYAEEKLQEKLEKRRKERQALLATFVVGKRQKVENVKHVVYIPPRWNVYLGQPGRGSSTCSAKRMGVGWKRRKKKRTRAKLG